MQINLALIRVVSILLVGCSSAATPTGGDRGSGGEGSEGGSAGSVGEGSPASGSCDGRVDRLSIACVSCAATACAQPLAGCCNASDQAGGGCIALVACAIKTGCSHATCYDPKTCKSEVDDAGGITGAKTAIAGELGACVQAGAAANADCATCLIGLRP